MNQLARLLNRPCAVLLVLLAASLAWGVIEAPRPLKIFVDDSNLIVQAKVEQFFPDKPALVFTVERDIKGKWDQRRLPVVVKLDPKAKDENFLPPLLKRLGPGQQAILFIKERGKTALVYGCANGSWFHMTGTRVEKDRSVWQLVSGEPNLRGTFKGTTDELRALVADYLAGKAKLPEPNTKEKGGFGPEYQPKQSSSRVAPLGGAVGGPLFAVIPTLGIGGPLAILAMLFPTVFGGVLVLFRQWLAFLTLFSINSLLLILHWLLGDTLRGSWWGTPAGLWFAMTLVALVCTLWAWRRQLANLALGAAAVETPRKTENLVLTILSLALAAAVGLMLLDPPGRYDAGWNMLLAFSAGIWIAAVFRLVRGLFRLNGSLRSTEGVILSGILGAHVVLAALLFARDGAVAGTVEAADKIEGERVAELVGLRWDFQSPDSGLFVSSVLVHGDRLYAAAAHPGFKVGTLYCLDRHSKKKLWEFIGDGELKEMISSPAIADGRLYIGEGFHDDPNCRLWCVDAEKGEKLWAFQTQGQTESSPAAYAGKVYFGAGNDGFYCLDALTGGIVWRFPAKHDAQASAPGDRRLRFGASPLVVDNRVYVGTGVDRNTPDNPGETRFFCFDAATGKELWSVAVDLPVWAGATHYGEHVFVALGNGDIFSEAQTPRGAVLCLDAKTGKEVWRYPLSAGVLDRPAVDANHVYVGCRDGHVYGIDRQEGKRRWQTDLGSPVVAAPALAQWCGEIQSVFAVATKGKVCCLEPHTGAIHWTYNLSERLPHLSSAPKVIVTRTAEGDRRQIYFGAGLNIPTLLDVAAGKAVVYSLEDKLIPR